MGDPTARNGGVPDEPRPRVAHCGEVPASVSSTPLLALGASVRLLLTHAMGSATEICDVRAAAGPGLPPHRHPWEETYLVLEGEVEVNIDGATAVVGPGGLAHVPANTVHLLRRLTDCHLQVVASRGLFTRFLAECSSLGPTDLDELVRVAIRHDVQILGRNP